MRTRALYVPAELMPSCCAVSGECVNACKMYSFTVSQFIEKPRHIPFSHCGFMQCSALGYCSCPCLSHIALKVYQRLTCDLGNMSIIYTAGSTHLKSNKRCHAPKPLTRTPSTLQSSLFVHHHPQTACMLPCV